MTWTGMVIIPLALVIILLPWRWSVLALVVFATLDSSAVLNVGSVGLQPGYFFALLLIGRTIVEIIVFRAPLDVQILRIMTPLFLFAAVCMISIWIGLTFFQGRIMVVSSTAGVNLDLAQPYTFQRQNLTQPFYLFLNVALLYCLAYQVARLPPDALARTLDRALVGAILFAGGIAVWEMAHFYGDVPFADAFFHSNAGYYQAHDQVLAGAVLRVSGPFSEPAALAYHFAGFLFFAWYRYLLRPTASRMSVVLLCVVMLAASTSTTAVAVLGIFALVLLKDVAVASASKGVRGRLYLTLDHLTTLIVVVFAMVCVAVFVQHFRQYVDDVLMNIVFEKGHSGSFEQRTGVDLVAVEIVMQTSGVGVGLGSHKPNNLLMTLLSNTGIAGFLTFAAFLFDILRPPVQTGRRTDLRPLRWFVLGLLAAHLIANPNLSTLILWIGFALIVGTRCSQRGCGSSVAQVGYDIGRPGTLRVAKEAN